MLLYIPEIGDHIRLTEDWTFDLHNEYRNDTLWEALGCDQHPEVISEKSIQEHYLDKIHNLQDKYSSSYGRSAWSAEDLESYNNYRELYRNELVCSVTLPKDSILAFDRIYIRKGASDFSSISFYLKDSNILSTKKKPRFWAKLVDCNKIQFEKTEYAAKK